MSETKEQKRSFLHMEIEASQHKRLKLASVETGLSIRAITVAALELWLTKENM
jgi:hypothetical protein